MFYTLSQLARMTSHELNGELAHARNARDAYSYGHEPADVMARLHQLLGEQTRRHDPTSATRTDGNGTPLRDLPASTLRARIDALRISFDPNDRTATWWMRAYTIELGRRQAR